MKIRPEIKEKWLQALKSGDYVKGKNFLKSSENEYCCLGVLCDLHREEHENEWTDNTHFDKYMGCGTYLPDGVADWAFEIFETNRFDITSLQHSLAEINDESEDFNKVIAEIEKL